MNKRIIAIIVSISLIFLGVYVFSKPKTAIDKLAKHPNLLMIMVDDMNDWLSFLNAYPGLETPNLEKLAAQSINFTNAHAPASQCNPSRSAVLTGKLPSTTGIHSNTSESGRLIDILGLRTLVDSFHESGYKTIGVGKIFHSKRVKAEHFDQFISTASHKGLERLKLDTEVENDLEKIPDHKASTEAIKILENEHKKPFMLSLGYYYPHQPWKLPEEYFNQFNIDDIVLPEALENDLDDVPSVARKLIAKGIKNYKSISKQELKRVIKAYLASIVFLDKEIGRVLDSLEASPNAKNTIVVFWSDHGYHLGSKEHLRKGGLWEEDSHVPFLISVPGLNAAEYSEPVSLINLYPSLVELCNLEDKNLVDGFSLVPIMKDTKKKWKHPTITSQGFKNLSLRTSKWRYTKYADDSEELYDHEKDPKEFHNLATDTKYQKIKTTLAKNFPKFNRKELKLPRNMIWIQDYHSKGAGGYFIDKHEVTNKEYKRFVDTTSYQTDAEKLETPGPGSLVFSPSDKVDHKDYSTWWEFRENASWQQPQGNGSKAEPKHPVVQVSFNDAEQFCHSIAKRIPTEAEWELAAGDLDIKKDGKWVVNIFQGDFPDKSIEEDGYYRTAPVASFPANENDLYDMAGNVWEWVQPNSNTAKGKALIKGGSFLCGGHCQGFNPQNSLEMAKDEATDHIGFRCIK